MTGEELPVNYIITPKSGQEVPPEDLPEQNLSGQEVPAEDLLDHNLSGKPVPPEDLPESSLSGQEVPASDLTDEQLQKKYATPGQQAFTIAENLGKGLSAGATTYLEQKLHQMGVEGPGLSDEDIKARQKANPNEALYSDIGGNVALSAMLPEVKIAQLGKVGAAALKGAISSGLFQTGDEISDGLLGQGNPVPAAVANIIGMGTLGLLTGGLGHYANKGISALADTKIGTMMKSILTGLGHAANFPESEVVDLSKSALTNEAKGLSNAAFRLGQELYQNKINGAAAAITLGHGHALEAAGAAAMVNKFLGKHIDQASQKIIGPMLMRAAASGSIDNLSQILDKATAIAKGNKYIEHSIEGLFSSVPQKIFGYSPNSSQEKIDKLKGMLNQHEETEPEKYAEGGEVDYKQSLIADNFPEHNMLMNAAKSRVFNYLNAARPIKKTGLLPYDSDRKNPQHEKAFDKTLHLAINPMSVLEKVKKGILVPKDMADLNGMYPEVHEHLSKKITERIMQGKLKGEKKPSYKTRQAMSLFLGSNLDSTLTPQNIMAAQAVFVQQKAAKIAANKTNALGKLGKNTQTAEQAREDRAND